MQRKPQIPILEIDAWRTIEYPERRCGSAAITHTEYAPGYYPMEGVAGYWFWHNRRRLPVTALQIHGRAVMVDDPLHWIGMQRLAAAASGKVMVGGLGLGLLVHHLLRNAGVASIDVIEASEDVIRLVSPLLPTDGRVSIVHDDILAEPWRDKSYDTIVNDVWVRNNRQQLSVAGKPGDSRAQDMLDVIHRVERDSPGTKVCTWGLRRRQYNPAVTIDMPPSYMNLINGLIDLRHADKAS